MNMLHARHCKRLLQFYLFLLKIHLIKQTTAETEA